MVTPSLENSVVLGKETEERKDQQQMDGLNYSDNRYTVKDLKVGDNPPWRKYMSLLTVNAN